MAARGKGQRENDSVIAFIGRVALAACVLSGLLAAPAARAQLAPGISGQSSVRAASHDEALWSLGQLGFCLGQRKSAQSRAYLATEPGSMAETAALNALLGRETSCLPFSGRMRLEHPLMRGAIAQGFYRRTVKAPLQVLPAPVRLQGTMTANDRAPDRDAMIDLYAGCVAATQPVFVHQLLTGTKLGSKDEAESIGRIGEALAPCLPAGSDLRLRPYEFRLVLAEAAFRRSDAS